MKKINYNKSQKANTFRYKDWNDYKSKFSKTYPQELMDVLEVGFLAGRELKEK